MEVDDPARDRQAEPRAARSRRPGRVGAVEPLEDPGGLRLGDAGPLVLDLDPHDPSLPACRDNDGPGGRRVPESVLEKVGHDLVDALGVPVRHGLVARDLHGDPDAQSPERAELSLAHGLLENGAQREGGPLQRDRHGFQP